LQPSLGIVDGGAIFDIDTNHLRCQIERLKSVDPREPEAERIYDLNKPWYLFFASGAVDVANGEGGLFLEYVLCIYFSFHICWLNS
jgi:hypothetical protein